MNISGVSHSLRIGGLLTAVAIGAAACGSSSGATKADSNTVPTPSTSSTPGAGDPSATPTPSLPVGCHGGVAHDVDSTLAILTDPAICPGSVNAYWKSQLGDKWTEPVFIPYRDGEVPQDACGTAGSNPDSFADNAFYCPKDDTIAYSRDLLNSLYKSGGPYLPVVILEHELGHRAAQLGGYVGVISRSEENQADCSAGVTTAYARTAHRLPFSDVIGAARVLYKFGDKRNFGNEIALSTNAHGTPAQRVIAFGRGYFQNLDACKSLGQAPTGSVA